MNQKRVSGSLRTKFTKFITINTLGILIIASIITIAMSFSMNVAANRRALQTAAQIGEATADGWFQDKERLILMVRDGMRSMNLDANAAAAENYLSYYVDTNDFLVDVYIATERNRMISGTHWRPDAGYDARTRDWYTGAMDAGSISYTAPYIDADSGNMVITVSVPLLDRSGVVAADLKLDSLISFVENATILDTSGRAFLLDPVGNIIAHTSRKLVPTIQNDTEQFTNIGSTRMKSKSVEEIVRNDAVILHTRGMEGRSAYVVTNTVARNGWIYGFEVPTSDFAPEYISLILRWILVIALMIVLSVITSRGISRSLLAPISTIIEDVKKIALGDMSVSLDVHTNDELEELASQLQGLVDSTNEQIGAMKQIAAGDFTVSVRPKSELDELTHTMNNVVHQLSRLVDDINGLADQVNTSSGQVANGAQNLASGAVEQAEDMDLVTNNLNSILNVTRENTANVAQSYRAIEQMHEMASTGTTAMEDMVNAVGSISRATDDINKIIGEIGDIAFQTNILALNAAVEAARAGSNGKGFAVVADEVRNLANRSAEAAENTTRLIENATGKAHDGVDIADRTQRIFSEIVEQINSIDDLVRKIDASTSTQVGHVAEINENVDRVNQLVQQTSATAQESAATSQELSSQANSLKRMLQIFRT